MFLELNYPSGMHALNLDLTFDYYAGLCSRTLRNCNDLEWKVYSQDADEEEKIVHFIEDK